MAHYRMSDPRLQDAIDAQAEQVAADWPPLDEVRRAALARLLAASPARSTAAVDAPRNAELGRAA